MVWFKKREEVEIRHVPSYYDKHKIPSLASTQLVFFDDIHIKKISGPLTTSRLNEYNFLFPIDKYGKVDVENDIYDMRIQQKKRNFNYKK